MQYGDTFKWKPKWLPFNPSDWLGGTAPMSLAAQGAYMRLLAYCWTNATCSIPADKEAIGRIVGHDTIWTRIQAEVLAKFHRVQDRPIYINARLWDERLKAELRYDQKSRATAGRRKGEKQLKQNGRDLSDDASSDPSDDSSDDPSPDKSSDQSSDQSSDPSSDRSSDDTTTKTLRSTRSSWFIDPEILTLRARGSAYLVAIAKHLPNGDAVRELAYRDNGSPLLEALWRHELETVPEPEARSIWSKRLLDLGQSGIHRATDALWELIEGVRAGRKPPDNPAAILNKATRIPRTERAQ